MGEFPEEVMMHEFLKPLNWFYKKYFGKDPLRFWSQQVALNLFVQRGGQVIVETGCAREKDDWGGGNSTVIFGDFAKRFQVRFETVDIEPKHLKRCKEYTKEYASNIKYNLGDSVKFLREFDSRIDLLYLDSLDFPLDPDDPKYGKQVSDAQHHNLSEFLAAENKLTKNSIVLIDDYDFPSGGKPGLTNDYLSNHGWECLIASRQILWIKKV